MTGAVQAKQATLFQTRNNNGYEPLSSVWEGGDGELLERMLEFYPSINPEPILDATHNAGRFWTESKRNVWSMDIDPQHNPRIVADNREMAGLNTRTGDANYRVPTSTFGTVVFDPPHVGPQGRDKSAKRFAAVFELPSEPTNPATNFSPR